jgi:hypothetical protein
MIRIQAVRRVPILSDGEVRMMVAIIDSLGAQVGSWHATPIVISSLPFAYFACCHQPAAISL